MITRKVNQKTFAWDPTAFRGKGYWFVSGKDGSFGRAASKAEAVALGKPKDESSDVKLPANANPQKDISEGSREFERGGNRCSSTEYRTISLDLKYKK